MKIANNIRLIIIFIPLFFIGTIQAQQRQGYQKKVKISSGNIHIDYTYQSPYNSATFSHFTSFWHECGMPALPILRDFVIIPKKAHPSFSLTTRTVKNINKVSIPQSKPNTIDSDPEIKLICDDSYLSINQFLPSTNGRLIKTLEFDTFDLLFFEIYPFQYNPAQKKLSIASELSVDIECDLLKNSRTLIPISSLEYSYCNSALNFQSIKSQLRLNSDTFPVYIIISNSQLNVAANNLSLWKSQQGYRTQVYLNQNWTSDSIQLLMQSLYQNVEARPQYLCILGDSAFVPSTQKIAPPPIPEAFATDLYYTTMDSDTDFVANFGYGRISVDSPSQAISVVEKLIHFQKFPPSDSAYYSTMVNCSYFQDDDLNGYDDRRFAQTSEEIRSYMQTNYGKNVIRIYEAPEASNPQFWNNDDYDNGSPISAELHKPAFAWTGNTSDIINRINAGTFLLLHRDHGYSNASGWAHPSLSSSQLPFLTNDSLLPIIFSINCYSGNFNVPESFAEKLLRQPSGASGIFAPSFYSYSGNNDAFALGLVDALFSSPGLLPNFNGTGGTHLGSIPNHASFDKPGDMLQYAVWYMNYTWGIDKYSSEIAHFFGDPAMPIQSSKPLMIVANHTDSIDCIDSIFMVTAANSSHLIATLTVNDSVVARCTFVNDTAILHFLPQYSNQAVLTITGRGFAPYVRNIYWSCSQAIYPPIAKFQISDSVVCNGLVAFTDFSENFPSSWNWDFGDGIYSSMQNPQHQYTTSGLFTVKLTVVNMHGSDSIARENSVQVFVPEPNQPIDTFLCHGDWFILQNLTPDSMVWYRASSPDIAYWGDSWLVNVNSDTTFYGATFIDMPMFNVGKIDTAGSGGYIYQNVEHGLIFNAHSDFVLNSVDVFALNASIKTIKVINSNNELVASKTVSLVTGKNTILLDFYIPQDSNYKIVAPTYCSWYANFNEQNYPFEISNVISIDSAINGNNYYFFYHWVINKRCYSPKSSSSIHLVRVDSLLSVSTNQMLCDLQPINVNADSTANCIWNNGASTSQLTINQPGDYFAQLEKQQCIYYTDTIHVFEYNAIIANVTTTIDSSVVCCHNFSQNAFTYYWDFGDGFFSLEQNPCHQYSTLGQYVITLTLSNNCDTISIQKSVEITAVNEKSAEENRIQIKPNPASSIVEISSLPNKPPIQINIYDMNGQNIHLPYKLAQSTVLIDVNSLSAGMYFIEISYFHTRYNLKFVKIIPE